MTNSMETGQEPNKRLMIREMVLENFKSYAGPQRVGPFHKSFSSVVGPNGSGKSNVIDAMLFVFGRRAKQLRFNKVSELIHNSSSHRNLEFARVTVFFQEIVDKEGDDYEVVPGSEFTVARTANRSNTSDYYVNDRRVSPKEVTERLKAKGIDLDNNRFLILQGEVESISMMKPKAEDKHDTGLLEYLEDIIGTDKYVQPIEESAKTLEEVNERRQGMIQRLKVVEKDKESLEVKKREAEEFLDKQAETVRLKMSATKISILHTQSNIARGEQSLADLQSKLDYERQKHQSYEKDAKERDGKFQAVDKEYQAITKTLESAQEEFKVFERKDAKVQMDLKHVKQKLKKVCTKLETDGANIQKLEAELSALEEELPRCREQVAQLGEQLSKQEGVLEAMLEEIKEEVEGYHQQLSQVRAQLAPWEKTMGECSTRVSVAAAERDMLSKKAEDAKRRLDAALKGLTGARHSADAKKQQIEELELTTQRCRQQIEQHKQELQAHRAEESRLEAVVQEARERAASLRLDVTSQQQQGGVVAALMAAKTRGEVSGVYGRLGDLGAVDAKYDVAVSTAVGALDFIVVETASDAQRCVEYLRRNNLGVATFLILEKQKHLAGAAAERLQTPEGVPRLFDLVKYKDERLRTAFFFAMNNTLVANDLEQASRIAYGADRRFRRVVTVQGQLIAESGTMSGGGGKPSRGRMLLGNSAPRGNVDAKALQAELKQAEQQLEAANQALRSARDQVMACEQALRAGERQLSDLETALPKARMEAEAEATKAHDIQQRLEELRQATEINSDDAGRIKELEVHIRSEEAALAQLRAETAGLEKQVQQLQQKIDGAGGDKLKKQKALVAKLQKDIDEAEADITKKGVQGKASAKQVDKLRKEMAKDGAEKEKLEGDVAKIEGDIKQMEEEAMRVMQQKEEAEAALDAKKAELEAARAERDKFQRDFGIIRQTEINIENQMESINKALREENTKINRWSGDLDNLAGKLAEITGKDDWVLPPDEDLLTKKGDDLLYKVSILEAEMGKMSPDMSAIEEYRAKEADYKSKAAELDAATAERDEVRKTYEALRKRRLDEFMAAFNVISLRLKEMYQMITLGGDAELELVDSLDPFSEGIVFSVRPPRKSWKNISNLSGGEKTLSSLSLVFALHHYKPTPLYVMDEIDAALDFKNVSIVGHYIKDRTKNAQFVIISLRNNMFELADRLVGIYKTDNSTKTVTINPAEFSVGAAALAQAGQQRGGSKAEAGRAMEDDGVENHAAHHGGPAPVEVA